jgi:HSP20 family protein
MRDLVPWGRQSDSAPTLHRGEQGNPVWSLRREMDRLFDDMFGRSLMSSGWGRATMSWPSVEVNESDKEVRVTAELPGMSDKDVDVHFEDGVLTLRGEKKSETEDKDRGYSERYYGHFERRLALPSSVTGEGCNASFRDGVLTVTLPKSEEAARGRRIEINAETKH